jgi:very-short-patch-repair endonuclease
VRFRRQYALDRLILDFYCPAHRLCIEVDGSVHDVQQDRDAARDEALASLGIRTLRFSNTAVFADLPAVLRRIEQELKPARTPVSPLPLAGEGGEP